MQIVDCSRAELEIVSVLFDAYRIFYRKPSDLAASRAFIKDNLELGRSKLFLLLDEQGHAVGFCQLYPATCSLAMRPYYYLSDLYVVESKRKLGYARRLMDHVIEFCAREGADRVTLETAATNGAARRLYESLGFELEDAYVTYHRASQRPSR